MIKSINVNYNFNKTIYNPSYTIAAPCPTPTHIVAKPYFAFLLFSSCNKVAVIREPLHPNGCPKAIDPPFTFTFVLSTFKSRIQAID